MAFRALFFILIGFFLTPSLFAESSRLRLSLEECLELAIKNNGKMEAHDYAIEGAGWQENEAKAGFKPVLEVTNRSAPVPMDASNAAESFFSGDITFFNATKIGLGMPIYSFNKLNTARRLATQGVEAAKQKKERDKGEIAFDVKRLYYGILLGLEIRGLMQDALEKINNQLKKEEEDQEHSPYEIAKLKVFKLELERRLSETDEKAIMAKETLRFQLGLATGQSYELKEIYLEPVMTAIKPLKHYLGEASVSRPDSKLVDIGIKAKQLEWQLEKKKLYPNIGLGGFFEIGRTVDSVRGVQATDDFNNPFNFTRAGVGLEIKGQFDIHGSRARIRRLQSEYHKVLVEEELAKEGIALDVKQAYEEARRFEEGLQIAEERKKLAHQMVFLSKSNVEVGVGEEQEYTDALQLLLFTRGEYFKAVFDYNVAIAKLDWKSGGER